MDRGRLRYELRRGLVEITDTDADVIARAMIEG
ncbi:hypothetical protein QE412_002337 [Microbacterium trichothecenolyticum]|uniref:Uncharacterized protein n=1 Tax=Microbacterium trichothecenolyticum TaxID=69370 RepID=A0ABU0TVT6_MICTR|nr:hypothetical protein [Microbacterium trichothecenolyticum]